MKKIILNTITIFIMLLMVNCSKDDFSFGSINAPANLQIQVDIVGKTASAPDGDGSGKVKFTVKADNAISYKLVFSDGTSENIPSGIFEKRFTKTGVNTYTVTVIASGVAGVTSNTTVDVQVFSKFSDDEAVAFLTANSATGVKWYWAQTEVGHLGVGPNVAFSNPDFGTQNYYPSFFQSPANDKANTCLYNSVMTFSLDGGQIKFKLDNKGETYFNAAHLDVVGKTGSEDACYPFNTSGTKVVSLSPSESFVTQNPNSSTQTRGTLMNFSDGGFMGYYVGSSSYEILSITANRMVVRTIDSKDSFLAWYHTFITTPYNPTPDVNYTNLVFSDEFNVDGAPNTAKWGYDTGANGWGNSEEQNYTTSASNVIVSGGTLKITAKKESSGGANYSSARLKTENKFEFTNGRIEVKAKLPIGMGTWPAIWLLGEDYATNTWPACGEIDIMEHRGSQPNVIHGNLHYPGRSGGNSNGNTKTITNASTEFHIYKAIWSPTSVKIYVDDVLYHTVAIDSSLPFNKDFFMILNVAMGGTFGGTIDPNFSQSTMEIDYVRIYQ